MNTELSTEIAKLIKVEGLYKKANVTRMGIKAKTKFLLRLAVTYGVGYKGFTYLENRLIEKV